MSKVTCIDVSAYQVGIDYNKVKAAGIDAVILRSGYGREISQKDKQFETHYKDAKAAGLKVGSYWYSYADSVADAQKEAAACLACIKGKTFDLPVYYDLEDSSQTHLGKKTLTEIAIAFCEAIKKGGYRAGVYANLNWFKNYLDYDGLKSNYSIWLAQYNSTNSLDCDIWQNSSSGNINGISGRVDTDIVFNPAVFNGGNMSDIDKFLSTAVTYIGCDGDYVCNDKLGLGYITDWCAFSVSSITKDCAWIGECLVAIEGGAGTIPRTNDGITGVWFKKGDRTPQAGDLITFRYGGNYTDKYHSDHIGIVESVDGDEITTLEGNVDGDKKNWAATSTFKRKTRYLSNDDTYAFFRYNKFADGTNDTPTGDTSTKPDITYCVRAGGKWLPAVTNLTDFAGVVGKSITDVAIKVSKGSVKYRVHIKGGSWLSWVTGYNTNDEANGYAGNGKVIDAVQVYYNTPSDIAAKQGYLKAKYRVSPVNGNYYSYQYDNETTNKQDGYAGDIGKAIDRLQLILE